MDKIRVMLPKKFDLVVGDTFQLFYRGVIEAPNPYCYDILANCEKGRNCPRYFEFLPEEPGQYKLTISVFGADKSLLGQGETILDVAQPKAPGKPLNILCMGSSTTAGGEWAGEAFRRLTATDGAPCGLGFENIRFIGTCQKGDVGIEGYGGWRWDTFLSTSVGSMWVVSPGNGKTSEDQHSLWKDENGDIWQLETLAKAYLKFNRYLQHAGERPVSGQLTHYKNAVNQEPIQIKSSSEENKSPYYDEKTGRIDFTSYCQRNGFDRIDVVYIMLGGNGLAESYQAGIPLEQHCKSNVEKGKKLVEFLREAYPDVKVRIMGLIPPSAIGGMGASYGASMPYCDYYGYQRYVLMLNNAYEEWTLEPEYRDFMGFVNISGQFDAENNMPGTERPVNTRSTKVEIVGINGIHPLYEGYMQVADAVYRNMVHLCKDSKEMSCR
ncbi:MAG: SGNH/GDSL hydrolase family protein [Oscillospiraceae bacterium]|nr:SGNH/GDSL hydrolase family protein [Oscillospiraceae bacterium]